MTLMARLCALCAMSALMQLVIAQPRGRAGLRMICGMLMLHLTLSGIRELAAQLADAQDLAGILESLMK